MSGFRERIVHPFRYARPGNWWFSKLPPLLAVAYLAILLQDTELARACLLLAACVLSFSCVAAYGHALNDAFDIEEDRRAGKPNAMASLSLSRRGLLIVTFLCAAFVPAIMVGYSGYTILLLALNCLWPAIYSAPGIRLKERGLLGVICDAVSSHVTPTLFVLSVFGVAPLFAPAGELHFWLAATLWAAALGIKGILHHQVIDRDNDIRSGTVTFLTTESPQAITRFLTWFNLLLELPVSAALAFVVYGSCPLAAAALATYCVLETMKYGLGFRFSLNADPRVGRASVPFANEQFYVLWLPLAAAAQLAIRDWEWAWLPLLHAAIFFRPLLLQLGELKSILATRFYRRLLFGPRK